MVDQQVERPTTAADTPVAPVERTVLGSGGRGVAEVPARPAPPNEGKTVAAWTTVAIVVVGAIVVAVGVAVSLPALAWSGAGVVVVGLVVGAVLRSLGYGQRARGTR